MAVDPKGKDTRSMPAGDERKDQVRANEDALAERAEREFSNQTAIDPKKFEIENETAQHLGANSRDPADWGRGNVKDADPRFDYKWIRDGADQIDEAENRFEKAGMNREDCYSADGVLWSGYEIVREPMKEARNRLDERGYRRISDTILVRAPKEIVEKYEFHMQLKTHAKENACGEGLMAQAETIARKHNVPPNYVIALAGFMEPGDLRRMGRQNLQESIQKQRIIADLKAGTIPGMEIARK